MKPPLRPFTVEVKRSRSHSSIAKPVDIERPEFIESKSAPSTLSLSQARQLADQMFASMTAASSTKPEPELTAQSVFRAALSSPVTAQEPFAELAARDLATPVASIQQIVQAGLQPRRSGKLLSSPVLRHEVANLKAPDIVKPVQRSAPKGPKRDMQIDSPEV